MLSAQHIDVGELCLRKELVVGYDEERKTAIVDLDRVREHIVALVKSSDKLVVVEGHYAPLVIPKEFVFRTIVLRCHPEELARRLRQEGMPESKIGENVEAEILDVCLYDALRAHGGEIVLEIDTTGKRVETIAEEVKAIVEGRRGGKVGIVNWMERLEREGKLDKYLRR